MAIGLTEFEGMCGFRPYTEIEGFLKGQYSVMHITCSALSPLQSCPQPVVVMKWAVFTRSSLSQLQSCPQPGGGHEVGCLQVFVLMALQSCPRPVVVMKWAVFRSSFLWHCTCSHVLGLLWSWSGLSSGLRFDGIAVMSSACCGHQVGCLQVFVLMALQSCPPPVVVMKWAVFRSSFWWHCSHDLGLWWSWSGLSSPGHPCHHCSHVLNPVVVMKWAVFRSSFWWHCSQCPQPCGGHQVSCLLLATDLLV
jgi:hypothetical protein